MENSVTLNCTQLCHFKKPLYMHITLSQGIYFSTGISVLVYIVRAPLFLEFNGCIPYLSNINDSIIELGLKIADGNHNGY